ncbi:hypothetical protein CYMTET_34364 [Cymbomonas tetramitiformis]|uniref:Uncharacterized protein n=1 Tax=Cymbomonas tetramitiformis TaxID=36881 RepID=A0AAE0FBU0_9CHLO|nr:hypothetical protein CYMTET_34364 [Cymbomonas tetramitiformis]
MSSDEGSDNSNPFGFDAPSPRRTSTRSLQATHDLELEWPPISQDPFVILTDISAFGAASKFIRHRSAGTPASTDPAASSDGEDHGSAVDGLASLWGVRHSNAQLAAAEAIPEAALFQSTREYHDSKCLLMQEAVRRCEKMPPSGSCSRTPSGTGSQHQQNIAEAWSCPACTLINAAGLTKCEACGGDRPAGAVVSASDASPGAHQDLPVSNTLMWDSSSPRNDTDLLDGGHSVRFRPAELERRLSAPNSEGALERRPSAPEAVIRSRMVWARAPVSLERASSEHSKNQWRWSVRVHGAHTSAQGTLHIGMGSPRLRDKGACIGYSSAGFVWQARGLPGAAEAEAEAEAAEKGLGFSSGDVIEVCIDVAAKIVSFARGDHDSNVCGAVQGDHDSNVRWGGVIMIPMCGWAVQGDHDSNVVGGGTSQGVIMIPMCGRAVGHTQGGVLMIPEELICEGAVQPFVGLVGESVALLTIAESTSSGDLSQRGQGALKASEGGNLGSPEIGSTGLLLALLESQMKVDRQLVGTTLIVISEMLPEGIPEGKPAESPTPSKLLLLEQLEAILDRMLRDPALATPVRMQAASCLVRLAAALPGARSSIRAYGTLYSLQGDMPMDGLMTTLSSAIKLAAKQPAAKPDPVPASEEALSMIATQLRTLVDCVLGASLQGPVSKAEASTMNYGVLCSLLAVARNELGLAAGNLGWYSQVSQRWANAQPSALAAATGSVAVRRDGSLLRLEAERKGSVAETLQASLQQAHHGFYRGAHYWEVTMSRSTAEMQPGESAPIESCVFLGVTNCSLSPAQSLYGVVIRGGPRPMPLQLFDAGVVTEPPPENQIPVSSQDRIGLCLDLDADCLFVYVNGQQACVRRMCEFRRGDVGTLQFFPAAGLVAGGAAIELHADFEAWKPANTFFPQASLSSGGSWTWKRPNSEPHRPNVSLGRFGGWGPYTEGMAGGGAWIASLRESCSALHDHAALRLQGTFAGDAQLTELVNLTGDVLEAMSSVPSSLSGYLQGLVATGLTPGPPPRPAALEDAAHDCGSRLVQHSVTGQAAPAEPSKEILERSSLLALHRALWVERKATLELVGTMLGYLSMTLLQRSARWLRGQLEGLADSGVLPRGPLRDPLLPILIEVQRQLAVAVMQGTAGLEQARQYTRALQALVEEALGRILEEAGRQPERAPDMLRVVQESFLSQCLADWVAALLPEVRGSTLAPAPASERHIDLAHPVKELAVAVMARLDAMLHQLTLAGLRVSSEVYAIKERKTVVRYLPEPQKVHFPAGTVRVTVDFVGPPLHAQGSLLVSREDGTRLLEAAPGRDLEVGAIENVQSGGTLMLRFYSGRTSGFTTHIPPGFQEQFRAVVKAAVLEGALADLERKEHCTWLLEALVMCGARCVSGLGSARNEAARGDAVATLRAKCPQGWQWAVRQGLMERSDKKVAASVSAEGTPVTAPEFLERICLGEAEGAQLWAECTAAYRALRSGDSGMVRSQADAGTGESEEAAGAARTARCMFAALLHHGGHAGAALEVLQGTMTAAQEGGGALPHAVLECFALASASTQLVVNNCSSHDAQQEGGLVPDQEEGDGAKAPCGPQSDSAGKGAVAAALSEVRALARFLLQLNPVRAPYNKVSETADVDVAGKVYTRSLSGAPPPWRATSFKVSSSSSGVAGTSSGSLSGADPTPSPAGSTHSQLAAGVTELEDDAPVARYSSARAPAGPSAGQRVHRKSEPRSVSIPEDADDRGEVGAVLLRAHSMVSRRDEVKESREGGEDGAREKRKRVMKRSTSERLMQPRFSHRVTSSEARRLRSNMSLLAPFLLRAASAAARGGGLSVLSSSDRVLNQVKNFLISDVIKPHQPAATPESAPTTTDLPKVTGLERSASGASAVEALHSELAAVQAAARSKLGALLGLAELLEGPAGCRTIAQLTLSQLAHEGRSLVADHKGCGTELKAQLQGAMRRVVRSASKHRPVEEPAGPGAEPAGSSPGPAMTDAAAAWEAAVGEKAEDHTSALACLQVSHVWGPADHGFLLDMQVVDKMRLIAELCFSDLTGPAGAEGAAPAPALEEARPRAEWWRWMRLLMLGAFVSVSEEEDGERSEEFRGDLLRVLNSVLRHATPISEPQDAVSPSALDISASLSPSAGASVASTPTASSDAVASATPDAGASAAPNASALPPPTPAPSPPPAASLEEKRSDTCMRALTILGATMPDQIAGRWMYSNALQVDCLVSLFTAACTNCVTCPALAAVLTLLGRVLEAAGVQAGDLAVRAMLDNPEAPPVVTEHTKAISEELRASRSPGEAPAGYEAVAMLGSLASGLHLPGRVSPATLTRARCATAALVRLAALEEWQAPAHAFVEDVVAAVAAVETSMAPDAGPPIGSDCRAEPPRSCRAVQYLSAVAAVLGGAAEGLHPGALIRYASNESNDTFLPKLTVLVEGEHGARIEKRAPLKNVELAGTASASVLSAGSRVLTGLIPCIRRSLEVVMRAAGPPEAALHSGPDPEDKDPFRGSNGGGTNKPFKSSSGSAPGRDEDPELYHHAVRFLQMAVTQMHVAPELVVPLLDSAGVVEALLAVASQALAQPRVANLRKFQVLGDDATWQGAMKRYTDCMQCEAAALLDALAESSWDSRDGWPRPKTAEKSRQEEEKKRNSGSTHGDEDPLDPVVKIEAKLDAPKERKTFPWAAHNAVEHITPSKTNTIDGSNWNLERTDKADPEVCNRRTPGRALESIPRLNSDPMAVQNLISIYRELGQAFALNIMLQVAANWGLYKDQVESEGDAAAILRAVHRFTQCCAAFTGPASPIPDVTSVLQNVLTPMLHQSWAPEAAFCLVTASMDMLQKGRSVGISTNEPPNLQEQLSTQILGIILLDEATGSTLREVLLTQQNHDALIRYAQLMEGQRRRAALRLLVLFSELVLQRGERSPQPPLNMDSACAALGPMLTNLPPNQFIDPTWQVETSKLLRHLLVIMSMAQCSAHHGSPPAPCTGERAQLQSGEPAPERPELAGSDQLMNRSRSGTLVRERWLLKGAVRFLHIHHEPAPGGFEGVVTVSAEARTPSQLRDEPTETRAEVPGDQPSACHATATWGWAQLAAPLSLTSNFLEVEVLEEVVGAPGLPSLLIGLAEENDGTTHLADPPCLDGAPSPLVRCGSVEVVDLTLEHTNPLFPESGLFSYTWTGVPATPTTEAAKASADPKRRHMSTDDGLMPPCRRLFLAYSAVQGQATPFGAAGSTPGTSSPAGLANPFGAEGSTPGTSSPAGLATPFAAAGSTPGTSSPAGLANPFGAEGSTPGTSSPAGLANPFAAEGSTPGTSSPAGLANPFAAAGSTPGTSSPAGLANPFAAEGSTPAVPLFGGSTTPAFGVTQVPVGESRPPTSFNFGGASSSSGQPENSSAPARRENSSAPARRGIRRRGRERAPITPAPDTSASVNDVSPAPPAPVCHDVKKFQDPVLAKGDKVGLGLMTSFDSDDQFLFFTRNGLLVRLLKLTPEADAMLYPTIAVSSLAGRVAIRRRYCHVGDMLPKSQSPMPRGTTTIPVNQGLVTAAAFAFTRGDPHLPAELGRLAFREPGLKDLEWKDPLGRKAKDASTGSAGYIYIPAVQARTWTLDADAELVALLNTAPGFAVDTQDSSAEDLTRFSPEDLMPACPDIEPLDRTPFPSLGSMSVPELQRRARALHHFATLLTALLPKLYLFDVTQCAEGWFRLWVDALPHGTVTGAVRLAASKLLPWRVRHKFVMSLAHHRLKSSTFSDDRPPEIQVDRRADPAGRGMLKQVLDGLQRSGPGLCLSMFKNPRQWWRVSFANEGVVDAGGAFRESLSQLSEELMSPASSLFTPVANRAAAVGSCRDTHVPVPDSTEDGQYRFLGMLMAAAMSSENNLALSLSPLIWKLLAGHTVVWADYDAVDAVCFSSHKQIIFEIETGEIDADSFFDYLVADLIEGANLTWQDVPAVIGCRDPLEAFEHIQQACLLRWSRQVTAMRAGMASLVPLECMALWSWQELERAVCGDPEIPVVELKQMCNIEHGVDWELRSWLWQALEEFSPLERALFLRFASGRSRLPANIKVRCSGNDPTYLPTASTCDETLKLPRYTQFEQLKEKLRVAIYYHEMENA